MQHKSAVWVFTILIVIATLYSLSFSLVSSNFEAKAETYAKKYADSVALVTGDQTAARQLVKDTKRAYLRDSANAIAYPIVGKTYSEVKSQELNLGLDLQGGMSVTLEVSIYDLVKNLADIDKTGVSKNANKQLFIDAVERAKEAQTDSQDDFITLLEREFNAAGGAPIKLQKIFQNRETGDKFAEAKSNEDIFDLLREQAVDAINNTEGIIKKRIDRFGVAQPIIQKEAFSGRISVELPGVDDEEEILKRLKATANLEFWHVHKPEDLAQGGSWARATDAYVKNRYPAEFAIAQDSIAADSISNLPQPEQEAFFDKVAPLRRLDLNGALSQRSISVIGYAKEGDKTGIDELLATEEFVSAFPRGTFFLWGANALAGSNVYELYALKDEEGRGKAILDGSSITEADNQLDELARPVVNMKMDQNGTILWGQMTEQAYTDRSAIAIAMDGLVYSAPGVSNGAIKNGSSEITMGGGDQAAQMRDAEGLAQLLSAGALPAPTKVVDLTSVGASLGQENITSGLWSFGIALLVVLLYMIFYYRGAGVVANIALVLNLFFLLGGLAAFGAALTLPGIAGIVLTVGMAVDANVLIFERIKEELRSGKGIGQALKDGYQRAYSAIIDANITTLVTAFILAYFGSGPIKGFATTLIIGIFTSLFSAIFITRLIFFNRLEKKKSISFSSKTTEKWFTKLNYDFIKKRKVFYGISLAVILLGAVSLFTIGLKQGVDFAGGRSYIVQFDNATDTEAVRTALNGALGDAGTEVKSVGDAGTDMKITTNFMIDQNDFETDEIANNTLYDGLKTIGEFTLLKKNKVDPTISDDFRSGARYATIFSLIFIFAYIAVRFRKWQFGLGALMAMVHDVLIVLIVFSVGQKFLPFSMEIDQAFIAAILTVIGYSINDTVVVFDRIREYLGLYRKEDPKTVINKALNSTLSRTINTSLSTFVVLLTIFIFAGDNIKGFVFALMIGVVVGTYSSLFIATPSVIDLTKDEDFQK